MFIAALFAMAKIWKQPKCPSREEWVKMIWYMDTLEYYSAIQNDNILIWKLFATTRMILENSMLSEISQTRKDKYCIISSTYRI